MPREERSARHRVLIIDDEESTRLRLARYLSKDLKIEAQLAGSCEQALRLGGDYAHDAILLDLLMPGIGGLEVLREIRSASPNAATPLVVISMPSDPQSIGCCLPAGASPSMSSGYVAPRSWRASRGSSPRAGNPHGDQDHGRAAHLQH